MSQRTRLAAAVLASSLGLPLAAHAQETVVTTTTTTSAPAAPAIPNLTQVLDASGITLNGHVDASYDLANTDQVAGVAFYQNPNSFVLHQAEVTVAKLPAEGFGAKVDVIAGSDARILNEIGQHPSDSYFNLTQAYAQYSHGPLTVMAGKFLTLAGYEVIDSSANPHATNSLLFNIIPLVHTGVRGAYKLGNNTFTVGVNNSQTFLDEDSNQQKTVELGYALAATDAWSLAVNGYVGRESTLSVDPNTPGLYKDQTRGTVDFVTNYKVTPDINIGANVDYVHQGQDIGRSNSAGVALYFMDHFRPNMRAGLRAEYLDVRNSGAENTRGVLGTHGDIYEVTATYGYSPFTNAELIGEVRYDKADRDAKGVYITNSAPGSANDDQILGTVKVIYRF